MAKAEKVADFEAHSTALTGIFLSHVSSNLVASASRDGVVKIWVTGETVPLMSLSGHKCDITALSFDDNEEHLLVGFSDGTVELWDLVRNGHVVRAIEGSRSSPVQAIAFFPTSAAVPLPQLAAIWRGMSVEIWNLATKTQLRSFSSRTLKESLPNSRCLLSFSPDGRRLVAASDSCPNLTVWSVANGEIYAEVNADTDDGVASLEFAPTKLVLSIGTTKGCFLQLNLDTRTPEKPSQPTREKISKLTYSKDGSFCVGIVSDGLCVLDAADKRLIGNVLSANWRGVSDVAFLEGSGPDSLLTAQLVIFAREKHNMQVWIGDVSSLLQVVARGPSEEELIDELLSRSYEQVDRLTSHLTNLRVAKAYVAKGKIKEAMDHLAKIGEVSLTHDVICQGLLKNIEPEALRGAKLTDISSIVGMLKTLLVSPREEYVEAALMAMQLIVKAFGPTLKSSSAPLQESITSFKRQCQQLATLSAKSRDLAKQIPV